MQESRPPQARRIDFGGAAVFTGGLLTLVYGLIRANENGWTNTVSIACWGVAVVLLAAFPLVERAREAADVRPRACSASRPSSAARSPPSR